MPSIYQILFYHIRFKALFRGGWFWRGCDSHKKSLKPYDNSLSCGLITAQVMNDIAGKDEDNNPETAVSY